MHCTSKVGIRVHSNRLAGELRVVQRGASRRQLAVASSTEEQEALAFGVAPIAFVDPQSAAGRWQMIPPLFVGSAGRGGTAPRAMCLQMVGRLMASVLAVWLRLVLLTIPVVARVGTVAVMAEVAQLAAELAAELEVEVSEVEVSAELAAAQTMDLVAVAPEMATDLGEEMATAEVGTKLVGTMAAELLDLTAIAGLVVAIAELVVAELAAAELAVRRTSRSRLRRWYMCPRS